MAWRGGRGWGGSAKSSKRILTKPPSFGSKAGGRQDPAGRDFQPVVGFHRLDWLNPKEPKWWRSSRSGKKVLINQDSPMWGKWPDSCCGYAFICHSSQMSTLHLNCLGLFNSLNRKGRVSTLGCVHITNYSGFSWQQLSLPSSVSQTGP